MNKKNSYILHLKNIHKKDEELTGHYALERALLIKEGFSTLPGFVLTSLSFDDFLRSTNLVEPVSLLLSEVKPYIKETAESVSEEIRNLILKAEIPKIIELPLIEAYKHLSPVLEDSFVSIEVSNIIENKFIPEGFSFKKDNLKGMIQIIDTIKEAWLTLFTPEALEYRVNEYYHGPLSIAIVINRISSGDVSGEFVYTGDQEAEIRAIYGIGKVKENIKQSDIYFVNPMTKVILDKSINPQKTIKIRKGSFKKGQEMLMDIEISEEWQDKQKVPDVLLTKILENAEKLHTLLKKPFKFIWSIESGKLIIENYEILKKYEAPTNIEDFEKEEIILEESKEDIIERPVKKEKKEKKESAILTVEEDENIDDIVLLEAKSEENEDSVIDSEFKLGNLKSALDISNLSSSKIHSAQYFDMCYFDGTEMVNTIRASEDRSVDKTIESIYVEVLAAAKTSESKNFLYSFSDLSYTGKLDDKFSGDERFIDNPEELLVEFIALKRVTDLLKMKTINFVLPSLRSFNNLKDLLRILKTYPEFSIKDKKIYAEISVPSFLFELTKIDDEIDGFILDYNKLLKLMVYRQNLRAVDNTIMFEIMSEIKKVADYKKLDFYIKLDSYKDAVIDQIIELGNVGVIFKSVPSKAIFEKLNTSEKVKLNLSLD